MPDDSSYSVLNRVQLRWTQSNRTLRTRSRTLLRYPSAQRSIPALLFAGLVISVSYRVTPNHGVLMYGDYPYYWPGRAFDGLSVLESSFLGPVRLVGMAATPIVWLPRVLSLLLPDSWTSYMLTYGLAYATCLTYYFVAYSLTKSKSIAYTAGLFIILNNVILEYIVVQPAHIFAALMVYALTLYLFITRRSNFRARHAVVLGLLSLALTHPLLWALEILLVAGLFVFHATGGQRVLAAAGRTFGLFALLHAYWLVPFMIGLTSSSTAEIYGGNQEAVFEGVRGKIHYLEAFDLFQYPGTWQTLLYRGRVPHVFYFATTAFVVTVFMLRGRRGPQRRVFLLLLAIYLISLNLGLGPNSRITGGMWQYAYERAPGFGFFRTFSRFFNVALVALALLVVYAFNQLRIDRFKYYRPVVGFFMIALVVSHLVFFTGDMNGTITAGRVPSEYASLNARLRDIAGDSSGIITFPNIEYEGYQWNANRNQKAFQQITYFKDLFLNQPVVFNRLALTNLNLANEYIPRLLAFDGTFKFYPSFDDDLGKVGAKYVLVHKDLFDVQKVINNLSALRTDAEAFRIGAVPYERYVTYFSGNPRYRTVEDNNVFTVYENLTYRPALSASRAIFQKVNDTTYRVNLYRLEAARTLTLLQRFQPGWQLYLQPRPSTGWCRESLAYHDGLAECAKGVGGHDPRKARLLTRGGTLAAPHTVALGYANEWLIDPTSIQKQFREEYYSVNPDGGIDVELLVYFRPQSYFYVGLLITATALVACLATLSWQGATRLRQRASRRHSTSA